MEPLDERYWPGFCCVPAFLARAVTELAQVQDLLDDSSFRRAVATALEAVVPVGVPNPWNLPTAYEPEEWGVSSKRAQANLHRLVAMLGTDASFSLEVVRVDEVPFQLYEDALSALTTSGAVVAVGFDFPALQRKLDRPVPRRRGWHVARLTPLTPLEHDELTVESDSFRFDYQGDVTMFDDSDEVRGDDARVPWPALISACRTAGGAFWAVRRIA